MQRALARLDRWLTLHRPDVVARRRPGVEVTASGGALSDAARAWFRWQDGVFDPTDRAGLVAGWQPLGWEASRAAAGLAARDPDALDGDWRAGWIPIAAHVGGNLLVLDAVAAFAVADAVVEVHAGSSTRVVLAPSLAVWVDALAETLEEGDWSRGVDGVWNATPENPELWERLVLEPPGYPRRHDEGWELAPSRARALDWREAYAVALAEAVLASLWRGVPRGDVALGVRLGAPLDDALARVDDAPPDRVAGELAPLAALLRETSHPRAAEITARWLSCATPFDALEALAGWTLADPSLRAALVSRTAEWARARVAGSVAWSLAFSDALAPFDEGEAAAVRRWSGRLRGGSAAAHAERLLRASMRATTDPAGAAARFDDALSEVRRRSVDDALDAFLVGAEVRLAIAVGRVDALLSIWTARDDPRCFAAMTALVRAGQVERASAMPDAAATAWLGDALALHHATLTHGDLDHRARRALQVVDGEDALYDAALRGAASEARVRSHLRRGARGAALAERARHQGALKGAAVVTLAGLLAQVPKDPVGARAADAESALNALLRWDELTPSAFAVSSLRRLLPRVLSADATIASPLRDALLAATLRAVGSV